MGHSTVGLMLMVWDMSLFQKVQPSGPKSNFIHNKEAQKKEISKMIVLFSAGDEPSCPNCVGYNAMLSDSKYLKDKSIWGIGCRDCGLFIPDGDYLVETVSFDRLEEEMRKITGVSGRANRDAYIRFREDAIRRGGQGYYEIHAQWVNVGD
jgi:hypothetical protein